VDIRRAASRLGQSVVFGCIWGQAWAGSSFGISFFVFLPSSPVLASVCTQQCVGLLVKVMHTALLHSDYPEASRSMLSPTLEMLRMTPENFTEL